MSLFAKLQRVVGGAPPDVTGARPPEPEPEPEPDPARSQAVEPAEVRPSLLGSSLARLRGALDRHTTGARSGARHGRAARDEGDATRLVTSAELREDLATAMPGGHLVPTPHGPTWVVDTVFEPEARHGEVVLADALAASYTHLEALTGDARLHGFDPHDALYLDIEATGLEHGAGTIAFMVGLGAMDGAGFRVRQLVLRDHEEEKALLALLWEALDRYRFLVSFNGKSFDLSVLQSRLVMNRFCTARESELKLRPHLDLLHVGRGLYKGVWSDVRLQTLEKRVLGFVRDDDMPGSLAPLCWFQWLREADARPLGGIARHNLFDVLSMLALAGTLARGSRPEADPGRRAALVTNLARLYLRKKQPAAALAVLDGLPTLADPAERLAAHRIGATCARRVGDAAKQRAHAEAWSALAPDDVDATKLLARLAARDRAQSGARRPRRPAARGAAPQPDGQAH